tara:strand:+ start:347 stop:1291 length:945 start_codon:yes stop_codon:yes gene_type:complete
MSKFVNIPNGDYTVSVQSGGVITLNTGAETGYVKITGDLVVEGDTTTVQSENLIVKDNIIELNDGETGSGVTLNVAGIKIDRGTANAVNFLFDESLTYNDPISNTNKSGAFTFRDSNNALIGIRVNSISTGGGDLNLINTGTGVVRVDGTVDYETQVTTDDILTNKKYVDDAIVNGIQGITIKSIIQGDSKVELSDSSIDGGISNFEIKIDNTAVATFGPDNTEIEGIEFEDNKIRTATSGNDLILESFGSSSVTVEGVLKLPNQVTDPTASNGVIIYGKTPELGNTGLFYVNSNNASDEVIGRNRSLLYSMLF